MANEELIKAARSEKGIDAVLLLKPVKGKTNNRVLIVPRPGADRVSVTGKFRRKFSGYKFYTLNDFPLKDRKMAFRESEPLFSRDWNRMVFETTYMHKFWGKGSGYGSFLKNTAKYRKFLQNYLKKNGIRSVLDVGCGDWQLSGLIDWSGIDYLGTDIVESVIKRDEKMYGNKHIHFKYMNSFGSAPPKADLLIAKDVLQHWSNKNIRKFFSKIKGRYKHVLITNTVAGKNLNTNIIDGAFRPLDISKPPFGKRVKELARYKLEYRDVHNAKIYDEKAIFELR